MAARSTAAMSLCTFFFFFIWRSPPTSSTPFYATTNRVANVVADVRFYRRQRNRVYRRNGRDQIRHHRQLQPETVSAAVARGAVQQSGRRFGRGQIPVVAEARRHAHVLQEVRLQRNAHGE